MASVTIKEDYTKESTFTTIADEAQTIENEHEIRTQFLNNKSLYRPSKIDTYLYENFGERLVSYITDEPDMILPNVEELVEFPFSGTPDFGKHCSTLIKSNSPGQTIREVFLRIRFKNSNRIPIKHIRNFLDILEYDVTGQCIQRYTGNFLDILNILENKWDIDYYSGDVWIPIPITFHQDLPFPIEYIPKNDNGLKVCVTFSNSLHGVVGVSMEHASVYVNFESLNPTYITDEMLEQYWTPRVQSNNSVSKPLLIKPRKYLFEQVQYCGMDQIEYSCTKLQTHFSKSIKALIWNLFYYNEKTGEIYDPLHSILDSAKLMVNGKDLTQSLSASYYNSVMASRFNGGRKPNLYCHCFTKDPTCATPTGTFNCNFNDIRLCLKLKDGFQDNIPKGMILICDTYGLNYNILDFRPDIGVGIMFI